ncbi:MAG: hypothetical protein AAB484_01875, partial [Patescibacteria group bacterium]
DSKIESAFEVLDNKVDDVKMFLSNKIDGVDNRLDNFATNKVNFSEHRKLESRVIRIEKKITVK